MMASPEQAAAELPLQGRMPDFFIVGHAKSGTTALYEMLRRHPQVFMPDSKEPMYFARDPANAPDPSAPPRFEQTGRRSETLADYLGLFTAAAPEQIVGEASTFYLWSQRAPERIARAQPQARIIAILREPASFLHSLHLQMLQNQAETETDLRRALALEPERRAGRSIPRHAYWPEALMYSDRVRYVEQLRRYERHFPREQMLVLIYDDFRRDNEGTLREVLRFLEVDEHAPLEVFEANPTIGVRAVRFDAAVRGVREARSPLTRALRGAVRGVTSRRLRTRLLYPLRRRIVYREPPPPDEALTRELRERFRGEVAALGEHLGRDLLGLWGYDRPA